MNINITCDRCNSIVEGTIDDIPVSGEKVKCTGGFYDVTEGYWNKFANEGEKRVCDSCMHSDLRYIKNYGESY